MWNSQNKSEIACVFASLILNENEIKVSEESLKKIFSVVGIRIENYWLYLFPNLLNSINLKDLVGISTSEKLEKLDFPEKEPVSKTKEEISEHLTEKESDEDMGFGLFD